MMEGLDEGSSCEPTQTNIRDVVIGSAEDAYMKLMRTAYEMALTPSMPHKHFEVLVKCQRENGVRLVDGRHNNKAGISLTIQISRP